MYSRFRHCVNTFPREYLSSELPEYPQYFTRSEIHPYFTDSYSYNEPFPCLVPVFPDMEALREIAQKKRYIQPIFICPDVNSCCEIYYKLKCITTSITLEYVRSVNPTISPATKNGTAEMQLVNLFVRDKSDENVIIPGNDKTLAWMKKDPLAVKLNPWYTYITRIKDQPMPGIGPPIGAEVVNREWTQGDYYSEASYNGEIDDMGTIRIYGVVKIRNTGAYAIIGITNLMPYRLLSGYVGRSPGYVYLGIQDIPVANYTTRAQPVSLPNGATTTIYADSTSQSVYSQSQGKYVIVETKYSRVNISFEFATGAFSPFL